MRLMTLVMLLIALLTSGAHGQQADEVFVRLVNAKSLRCDLQVGTQASWDGGTLKLERSTSGEGGRLTFDSINRKAGSARIIGNAGASDVQVLATVAGLTFVEQTGSGNVNFTTVFAKYQSDTSRRFIAVTSRHLSTLSGPFPSQSHGTCSILE